jgi:hypothetical protein
VQPSVVVNDTGNNWVCALAFPPLAIQTLPSPINFSVLNATGTNVTAITPFTPTSPNDEVTLTVQLEAPPSISAGAVTSPGPNAVTFSAATNTTVSYTWQFPGQPPVQAGVLSANTPSNQTFDFSQYYGTGGSVVVTVTADNGNGSVVTGSFLVTLEAASGGTVTTQAQ